MAEKFSSVTSYFFFFFLKKVWYMLNDKTETENINSIMVKYEETFYACYRELKPAEVKINSWSIEMIWARLGWLGVVKVSCILPDQLILAYNWARPAILVAGKSRGGMILFLLFLHFHSCSSFFPVPLFHLLYYLFYLFSLFLWETTQNDPQGLKLINRYKRIGYSLDIMRQTACLVVNPIIVDGYASLFNCTTAVRASDSVTSSS